ncbi:hypothetical protein BB559_003155 [Furculomyces boomerangus]|uniref:Carbonyl reductase [NADPH] 1 n=1 Tax=Furculomyces boomerangus TaxID=61424 RepID=A0A2T9YN85_9FUNG|nr:hypothetical protein BB559_003155 [Furculomyces boomerangus]
MRHIIVTGANKGLGYGIVKNLALQSKTPTKIYLTARDQDKGKAALRSVISETQNKLGEGISVAFHQLDITVDDSIKNFVQFLKSSYGNQCVDVLINNAGYATKGPHFDGKVAESTLGCNYFGTVKLTEEILGLMKQEGRIIFLSGILGKLKNVPKHMQDIYSSDTLDMQQLNEIQKDFVDSAFKGLCEQKGYPKQAYAVSKVGITAYARVLARRFANDPRHLFFGAVDPGWVKTDMGGSSAPLSVDQGVQTPVHLANAEIDSLSKYNGMFFSRKAVAKW